MKDKRTAEIALPTQRMDPEELFIRWDQWVLECCIVFLVIEYMSFEKKTRKEGRKEGEKKGRMEGRKEGRKNGGK